MSGSHLCIPRIETVQPSSFQNRIIIFYLLIPTLIYRRDLNISMTGFCCSKICGSILGIYKSPTDTWMNVEIGTEAVQIPEKEYINGIFVAVYYASRGGPRPVHCWVGSRCGHLYHSSGTNLQLRCQSVHLHVYRFAMRPATWSWLSMRRRSWRETSPLPWSSSSMPSSGKVSTKRNKNNQSILFTLRIWEQIPHL